MFGYSIVKTSELASLRDKLDRHTRGLTKGTAASVASAARRKAAVQGEV